MLHLKYIMINEEIIANKINNLLLICELCQENMLKYDNNDEKKIDDENKNNEELSCQYTFKNQDELNSHIINSHPILVDDCIYLGNMYMSADYDELKRLEITHILNCAIECKNHFPDEFTYCNCELDDDSEFPIEKYFSKAVEFISTAVSNNKKVFVHCKLGRSRSASMILAFLIAFKKMSFEDAFNKLVTKKPLVIPNPGFVSKLKKLNN